LKIITLEAALYWSQSSRKEVFRLFPLIEPYLNLKINKKLMYQKDFILRMIEMIGELIAGILGLIKKGEFEQASQSIENAYLNILKEDASLFRRINKEKLTEELIKVHNYTNDHLEILSELFYAEAELLFAKNMYKESLEYYEKTLLLCKYVEKESKSFSQERHIKLLQIQNRIAQIHEGKI
jgi:hypothetical protein